MKVLLIGEYSRFHNSLKEGLVANDCEVYIVGHGDSFKNFPVDYNIDASLFKNNYLLTKLRNAIHLITGFDIASFETYFRFRNIKNELRGFDVVQLINETPFNINLQVEWKILKYLLQQNKKAFLVSCSDDYIFIQFLMSEVFSYSTLTPFLQDKNLAKKYKNTLRYITKSQKRIHDRVFQELLGVIPASVEYLLAYKGHSKMLPLIPYPINVDKIKYEPLYLNDKIIIFHGINEANYLKKGNNYFEKALEIIQRKYRDKIEIVITRSLPYAEYIDKLKQAHIVLDQTYAHDQGVNALEAMAMGKVVFTGAGKEFYEYYDLDETVAINAKPDVQYLAGKLEELINNPHKILEIGSNARAFVEKEHHYITIAKRYLDCWKSEKISK